MTRMQVLLRNFLGFNWLSRRHNFLQSNAHLRLKFGPCWLGRKPHVAESDTPALALEADEPGIGVSTVRFAPIGIWVVEGGYKDSVEPDLVSLIDNLNLVFVPGSQAQWIGAIVFLDYDTPGRLGRNVIDGPGAVLVSAVRPRRLVDLHFKPSVHSYPGLIVVRKNDARVKAVRNRKTRVTKANKNSGVVVGSGELELQSQNEIAERTREIA